MKIVALLAAGVIVGTTLPILADGTPPSVQGTTAQALNVPSKESAQSMIIGEWENMVGPNPATTRLTDNTLWNSQCWEHYQILEVRSGKVKKHDAYIVELEFTSAGGPGDCGHSNETSFSIALISADDVHSGKATTIWWLDCNSEKDFKMALQYPDPRDSNAVCSRYVSNRIRHR